ncbi:MAG: hypothetical protein K9W46_01915 [Candidatus Heimdallarchaeum endolithica]|uniref:Alpha/beta hydrolase n=1 Tax=Candidatus Heimdallarchaeum endolithica TaxID=2876572 RepID=A0A9Y1BS45_9ARCH|nr:MAG: hypothetical protein K9W46_01915 [Candidatus Heimdallarchaeum endolithica]
MNDIIDEEEEEDIYSSFSKKYTQRALFYNEAKKEFITMSDGAELYSYYTKKGKHSSKFSLFFVPGWSTAPFSWNDTWDELYKYFDLYVLETREKRFSKMNKKHTGTMERHALDVKEAIEYYNLDLEKTVILGPCFGAAVNAHAIAEGFIKPKGSIFISPTLRFPIPRKLIPLAYFPADFTYNFVGKPLLKLWIGMTIPKGIQRKTYFELFDNGKGSNWKKSFPIINHNCYEDYIRVDVRSWLYGTMKDRMHKGGDAVKIAENMKNGTYVEVPNYYFMHHNPGSKEFTKKIIENVKELAGMIEVEQPISHS